MHEIVFCQAGRQRTEKALKIGKVQVTKNARGPYTSTAVLKKSDKKERHVMLMSSSSLVWWPSKAESRRMACASDMLMTTTTIEATVEKPVSFIEIEAFEKARGGNKNHGVWCVKEHMYCRRDRTSLAQSGRAS